MSQQLISRNADLKRLRDEGYDVSIKYDHLVIRDVPYVNSSREVKHGYMVTTLELQNDITQTPIQDHVMMFCGDYPCDHTGAKLEKINANQAASPGPDLPVQHRFSSKPQGGYRDYHQKVTTYINILMGPAQIINPDVKAQTYPTIRATEEESIFLYLDTATSRAGITTANLKLELAKVAIVGLGGTGSYVLDLVAKAPVKEIHLYDADRFSQHNAFRSPSAASPGELDEKLTKVAYFSRLYSKFRRGIVPHPVYMDEFNLHELQGLDFVFISIDDGAAKRVLVNALTGFGVPFIDVGAGLRIKDDTIAGGLRVTTVTPQKSDHVEGSISFGEYKGENVYEQNIQVADLNALNAALAVIRWKKEFGFYAEGEREHQTLYTIDGNLLANDQKLCPNS